jgi:hypothetical protein
VCFVYRVTDDRNAADLGRDGPEWFGRLPVTTTLAPSEASRRAVAAPMPVPPPLTCATLPSSCIASRTLQPRVAASPTLAGLAQHPNEHRSERPVPSQSIRSSAKGAAHRVAPELSDPVGPGQGRGA